MSQALQFEDLSEKHMQSKTMIAKSWKKYDMKNCVGPEQC